LRKEAAKIEKSLKTKVVLWKFLLKEIDICKMNKTNFDILGNLSSFFYFQKQWRKQLLI